MEYTFYFYIFKFVEQLQFHNPFYTDYTTLYHSEYMHRPNSPLHPTLYTRLLYTKMKTTTQHLVTRKTEHLPTGHVPVVISPAGLV